MLNPLLTKSFKNGGAIVTRYRIVKFGSDDDTVVQAAAATDSLIGVADSLGAAATDTRVEVIINGIAEVEYGGNVTRGALLTADSDGKAVAAAPTAGSNVRIIGVAAQSGVAGDIGSVILSHGSMQG